MISLSNIGFSTGARLKVSKQDVKINSSPSLELLQLMIDYLPVAMFCKDASDGYKYVFWNQAAEKLWKMKSVDVLGKTDEQIWPKEIAATFREKDIEAIRSRKLIFIPDESSVTEAGIVTHMRTWKVPIYDDQQKPRYVLGFVQDMTESKQHEMVELQRTRQLRGIAQNLPGVIYQLLRTKEGMFKFNYVSPRARDLWGPGLMENSPEGTSTLGDHVHPEDLDYFRESIRQTTETLQSWVCEFRMIKPGSGEIVWLRGASEPTLQPDGNIIWDGLLLDITERKKAEDLIHVQQTQLAESARLAALGEMAGGVAHEINTPLNTILLAAEVGKEKFDEGRSERLGESFELIRTTAERIGKIVQGMKSMCRDGSNDVVEPLTICELIKQTLDICRQRMTTAGIELQTDIEDGIYVNGRSVQLAQVLLNLLNNAYDAVATTTAKKITISARSENGEALISVIDSGIGIEKDFRNKIFQPFFTTKMVGAGTGLGLSISKKIIQDHGGALVLDSSRPGETRFTIRLKNAAFAAKS